MFCFGLDCDGVFYVFDVWIVVCLFFNIGDNEEGKKEIRVYL